MPCFRSHHKTLISVCFSMTGANRDRLVGHARGRARFGCGEFSDPTVLRQCPKPLHHEIQLAWQ
jgi:hypothetical protein